MAVPERMSDRHVKSGEDMMEVLAHDIMRYETLSEQSDLFALASALAGNAPNDQYTVIELNVSAVPQVAQPTAIDKKNSEPLPDDAQEGRFKAVTDEDTDQFLRDNINNNTNYKTKSNMEIFTDWLRSNMEFRDVTDIPAVELDSLLARIYLDLISPIQNMNIELPIYEQRRYGMFTPAVESQYNMIMDDIHMQHRATREFIPPERKDEKYWFKRVRNNVSARKSRMKRKAMDKVIERKLLALQNENIQLRNELAALNMMYLHRPTDKRTASIVSPNVIKEEHIQKDAIDDKDEEEVIDVSQLDYARDDDNSNETTGSNSFKERSGRSLDTCDSNSLDTCNSGSIDESGINNLDTSGRNSRDASCSRLETHLTSYDSNDSSREDISSNSSGKSEMNDFRGYSMSPLMRENFSPGIHYSGNYSSYIGKHKNGLNIDKLKLPELSPMQGWVRPTPRYMSTPLNTQAMMTFQSEIAIVPYMMMKQMNDTNEGSNIMAVPHKIRIKEKIHSAFTKKNCD